VSWRFSGVGVPAGLRRRLDAIPTSTNAPPFELALRDGALTLVRGALDATPAGLVLQVHAEGHVDRNGGIRLTLRIGYLADFAGDLSISEPAIASA
jgi:hypothetical protein